MISRTPPAYVTQTQPETRISSELLDRLSKTFAATAEYYDHTGEFPQANFELLAKERLLCLTVPLDFNGYGASLGEVVKVIGAIAKGEPSTALILFMTYNYHARLARTRSWPPKIHRQLALEAVEGHGLIGALRVERELGATVRGGLPTTTARRTATGWVLNGTKIYATGSTGVDWFSVWAKTDEKDKRVGEFLVKADAPGIAIETDWDHLGMRATASHAVDFNDTPISEDQAVDVRRPDEWASGGSDPHLAIWSALGFSAIYDGVAHSARNWLRTHLNARAPNELGVAFAKLPNVQEKFGEIELLLQVNQTLIHNAVNRYEEEYYPSVVESHNIQYIATKNAIRVVEIGLELTGYYGLSRRNPLERHYRDVLCGRIHSPQPDTILMNAGRYGLR